MHSPNVLAEHMWRRFQACVTPHKAWDWSAALRDHSYIGLTTSLPKNTWNPYSQHSFPGPILVSSFPPKWQIHEGVTNIHSVDVACLVTRDSIQFRAHYTRELKHQFCTMTSTHLNVLHCCSKQFFILPAKLVFKILLLSCRLWDNCYPTVCQVLVIIVAGNGFGVDY